MYCSPNAASSSSIVSNIFHVTCTYNCVLECRIDCLTGTVPVTFRTFSYLWKQHAITSIKKWLFEPAGRRTNPVDAKNPDGNIRPLSLPSEYRKHAGDGVLEEWAKLVQWRLFKDWSMLGDEEARSIWITPWKNQILGVFPPLR